MTSSGLCLCVWGCLGPSMGGKNPILFPLGRIEIFFKNNTNQSSSSFVLASEAQLLRTNGSGSFLNYSNISIPVLASCQPCLSLETKQNQFWNNWMTNLQGIPEEDNGKLLLNCFPRNFMKSSGVKLSLKEVWFFFIS